MSNEEQLRNFPRSVLDNPLHCYRAEYATLGRDSNGDKKGLVAEHRRNCGEDRLEELEDVEWQIPDKSE